MKREIGRWTRRERKLSVASVERPRASRSSDSASSGSPDDQSARKTEETSRPCAVQIRPCAVLFSLILRLEQLPERTAVDRMTSPHDEHPVALGEPKHSGHTPELPDVRNRMERVGRQQVGEHRAERLVAVEDVNGVETEAHSDKRAPAGGRHAENTAKTAFVRADDEGRLHHTVNTKGKGPWKSSKKRASAFLQGLLLELHLLEQAFVGFLFYDPGEALW